MCVCLYVCVCVADRLNILGVWSDLTSSLNRPRIPCGAQRGAHRVDHKDTTSDNCQRAVRSQIALNCIPPIDCSV